MPELRHEDACAGDSVRSRDMIAAEGAYAQQNPTAPKPGLPNVIALLSLKRGTEHRNRTMCASATA